MRTRLSDIAGSGFKYRGGVFEQFHGLIPGEFLRPRSAGKQLIEGGDENLGTASQPFRIRMIIAGGEPECLKTANRSRAGFGFREDCGCTLDCRPAVLYDIAKLLPVRFHNSGMLAVEDGEALEKKGHSIDEVLLPCDFTLEEHQPFIRRRHI